MTLPTIEPPFTYNSSNSVLKLAIFYTFSNNVASLNSSKTILVISYFILP